MSKVGDVELAALESAQAAAHLSVLLAAWHRGMREPLPLAARTAFDFLKGGGDAAGKTYEGAFPASGRGQDRRLSAACLSRLCGADCKRRVFCPRRASLAAPARGDSRQAKSEAAHSERAAKADKTAGAAA
ncbi:hypothetical protein [Candidatus Accumulibacter sp. ACC012]|uniref:hypothetical protein n=1 Tax=Candidatus Accumulibacter sp. ACC012 TaxID=2823332 RepID=UPI0034316AAB